MTASEQVPEAAARLFSTPRQREQARRYFQLLARDGVERGLIGPREVPRLWGRHVLAGAVVARAVRPGGGTDTLSVADVGSGAGLPGIPMAIGDPGLVVTLVEPMERRATFLHEVIAHLGLADRVTVERTRAEQAPHLRGRFDVVTARAVARLPTLLPLVEPLARRTGSRSARPTGRLVLVKGQQVAAELLEAEAVIKSLRLSGGEVVVLGEGELPEPTTVVCFDVLGGRRSTGSGSAQRRTPPV